MHRSQDSGVRQLFLSRLIFLTENRSVPIRSEINNPLNIIQHATTSIGARPVGYQSRPISPPAFRTWAKCVACCLWVFVYREISVLSRDVFQTVFHLSRLSQLRETYDRLSAVLLWHHGVLFSLGTQKVQVRLLVLLQQLHSDPSSLHSPLAHTFHPPSQNCLCFSRSPLHVIVFSQSHHDAIASNRPGHEGHLGHRHHHLR